MGNEFSVLDREGNLYYNIVAGATVAFATVCAGDRKIVEEKNMPSFMKHVGEIWRCANLYRMEKLETLELSSYQDSYLVHVCDRPGITQEQLSKLIYVHKSNVARQLSSLEEKGYVERRPDPCDKRNILVFPTEKARRALPFIRETRAEWNALILDGLSQTEQDQVREYLRILADNAKRILEKDRERE